MVIDVHHHYANESYYQDYKDFPAELVAAMDRNGIDWTCLNALGPPQNREKEDVARAVERFPDRIIGMGYVDMDRESPGRIDDLKGMGMRGLKIIATRKRYDDDAYLPFYERAQENGLPILFHTGFLGGFLSGEVLDISSDRYRPITLDRIARLFPGLVAIAAHMGTAAWFQEAVLVVTHPNVYGDTSGGMSNIEPDFFRMPFNNRVDWGKVVFGSDSLPNDVHIPLESVKRLMRDLKLDEDIQRGVLGDTAARIFSLGS